MNGQCRKEYQNGEQEEDQSYVAEFVAGKSLVPSPAAGIMTFIISSQPCSKSTS